MFLCSEVYHMNPVHAKFITCISTQLSCTFQVTYFEFVMIPKLSPRLWVGSRSEKGCVEVTNGFEYFFLCNAFCQSFIIYLSTKSRHVLCRIYLWKIRTWTLFLHNVNHITQLKVPKMFWTLTPFHWVWNMYICMCILGFIFSRKGVNMWNMTIWWYLMSLFREFWIMVENMIC